MLKLKLLSGDIDWKQFGAKWITKKLNNENFDYWLVVDFINFLDATGEKTNGNIYVIEIRAIAPSQVPEYEKQAAIRSCGYEPTNGQEITDETWAQILDDYGIHAVLKTLEGNNANKLMKEARKQLMLISGLFGFFMDRELNRIGTTGWDFIKGDIMAPLKKPSPKGEGL